MNRRHFIKLASGLLVAAPVAIAVEPVRRFWQVSRRAPVGGSIDITSKHPGPEWWGSDAPNFLQLDDQAMLDKIKAEFTAAMEPLLNAKPSGVVVRRSGHNSRMIDIKYTVQLPGQIILDGFDHG